MDKKEISKERKNYLKKKNQKKISILLTQIFILVIFLFLFLFKLLFNTATTILELKEKDYEPLYMYLNEILLEKKIKG